MFLCVCVSIRMATEVGGHLTAFNEDVYRGAGEDDKRFLPDVDVWYGVEVRHFVMTHFHEAVTLYLQVGIVLHLEETECSKQEGLKQVLSLLFVYFPLHPLDSHLKEEVDQVLVRTFSADTT